MDRASCATRRVVGVVIVAGAGLVLSGAGCAAPHRMNVSAQRFRIEASLDPSAHRLLGRTVMDVTADGPVDAQAGHAAAVDLTLHPDLRITRVRAPGVGARYAGVLNDQAALSDSGNEDGEPLRPRMHRVVLRRPVDAFTLVVDYEGALVQDASQSEIAGEIHNFEMRAHIGEDGVYLADGHWYPEPVSDSARPPLADFVLTAQRVPGFELAASGDPDTALAELTGAHAWRSPYPLEGMVLVGGPHRVFEDEHNGVAVRLHLKPDQAAHAPGLICAVKGYMNRYEPLIGPYPADTFSIVDNFFSSGFAFPTFTLLSSAVIEMGERSQQTHGYLDHEFLHCWWGNGIHVDPEDGNWCEALASYGANYYGHVLDGDPAEARRRRRNYVHFLSRIEPDEDKPLGTYGQEDGCGRGLAYGKGAMVFHMMARRMGQDRFWAAMRKMTDAYVGRYASWEDIRRLCEAEAALSLERFFRQWVRSGGAPRLSIESAVYDTAGQVLSVDIAQQEPAFDLTVPIRVYRGDDFFDVDVAVDTQRVTATIPVDAFPAKVALDPDYHVFRKVPVDRIVPTTSRTRYGSAFASVLPAGDAPKPYRQLASIFASSFDENERIEREAGGIEEGALAERCALILGDAVHDSYVAGFLTAVEFPVRFTDAGFVFEGVTYEDPTHAVLGTVGHPGVKGGGITVVYANSPEAIPSPFAVPMYEHGAVIFENQRPVVRRDFEPASTVAVERR